jgi:hypothetical protein
MSTKPSSIELDKEKGIIIQLQNGTVTQTITLDGNAITMEVKGDGVKSTIVQTADSVTVKCDNFVVDSKTVKCTGSVSAALESGPSQLTLTPTDAAMVGPTTAVTGELALNLQSAADANVSATGAITVNTAGEVAVTSGANINLTASIGTEMTATNLVFNGIPEFL